MNSLSHLSNNCVNSMGDQTNSCHTGPMSEYEVASRLQRHDLHKLHGLGNDFLVWFRPELPDDAAQHAKVWCDRRTGIGADGLIIAVDDRVAPRFVLFNSDGSRAELSGNGLRCFGHAIAARRGKDDLSIIAETDAGDRLVEVAGALQLECEATVGMGTPSPGPSADALDLGAIVPFVRADTVDVGNPHIVVQVEDLEGLDIHTIGPAVEAHFLPTGINVHLVVATDHGLRMLIWERGAGATEACGSGATAAAAIASLTDRDRDEFRVDMPGGTATVLVGDELRLRGPSSYVAALDAPVVH